MVNNDALTLLQHLKQSETPVSGAALARNLGLSRVALWKRFEVLRAAGYQVEADRRGYRLANSDKPLPWEFPGEEERIFHFETLESTMDEALRQGLAGLPEGAIVAEKQSAGRGREDKKWESSGGDLLVTLVLRPALPQAYVGALGLEALTALAETLEALYGLTLTLKWPNDLMAGDRKVAGVLVESWGSAERPRFYTVGLGLNVHGLPGLDRPVASVATLGRPQADRRSILADWRSRLGRWCLDPAPSPRRWESRAQFTRSLSLETFDGQVLSGLPQGFDRSGSLLLGPENTPIRYGESRRTQGAPS